MSEPALAREPMPRPLARLFCSTRRSSSAGRTPLRLPLAARSRLYCRSRSSTPEKAICRPCSDSWLLRSTFALVRAARARLMSAPMARILARELSDAVSSSTMARSIPWITVLYSSLRLVAPFISRSSSTLSIVSGASRRNSFSSLNGLTKIFRSA